MNRNQNRSTLMAAFAVLVALSACGGKKVPELMNIRSASTGPDEFSILPTKPLEEPLSYSDLPDPTPGGANITDPTPNADAIEALGGNGGALQRDGQVREGGLLASATRYGVTSDIRSVLAAEDLEFRRRNKGRPLERLFNVNVYFQAYRRMSLDQYLELERLRRLGIQTPSAPPEQAP
jgi:hypothetical protein